MRRTGLRLTVLVVLLASSAVIGLQASDQAPADETAPLLLILDASGSMWGQIEGENKIVIARRQFV